MVYKSIIKLYSLASFFLEHVGELHIFILRRKGGEKEPQYNTSSLYLLIAAHGDGECGSRTYYC
jgi:hypothetical protein